MRGASAAAATVVTHPDREGTGIVVNSDGQAWTPNDLTAAPPAAGMVKVRWSDSVDPTQLYWEYFAELRTVVDR